MLKNFPFKAIVLLALPASGKTTLVKSLRRDYGDRIAMDLDYKGSKTISVKVRALHTQLINARIEEGVKVITTFDNWIDPLSLDSNVLCVYCLPKDVSVLTNRSRVRGDRADFSSEYSKNAKSWLEKWVKHADLYRQVSPYVTDSLVIKAVIDFRPWSGYLDQWFYNFVTLVKDFLGENHEPCGDDSLERQVDKSLQCYYRLKEVCGLNSEDLNRLQLLNFRKHLPDCMSDEEIDYAVHRHRFMRCFHEGLRSRDEIDDVPGGDDYCGSSEC